MASMLTPENFITAFKFIFGGYGLQVRRRHNSVACACRVGWSKCKSLA